MRHDMDRHYSRVRHDRMACGDLKRLRRSAEFGHGDDIVSEISSAQCSQEVDAEAAAHQSLIERQTQSRAFNPYFLRYRS